MIYKKNTLIISIIAVTLLVGCGESTSTNTPTTQCRDIQPILKTLHKKYTSPKDKYAVTRTAYKGSGGKDSGGSGGGHNEGINCLNCHNFASAGTVFNNLHATNYTPGSAGYRIKLSTGTVYGSARGTGNSLSYSFPSGNFTAQVIDPNGNIVNSSANMSHNSSRRACNSCHTASGNNGAPGRITSKRLSSATPVTSIPSGTNCTNTNGSRGTVAVSFNSNVLPILTAKCKVCHGSNGRFTVTTANATYANISSLKGSASAGGQYLLDKSSNTIGHGGGQVISGGSAEYTTIKAWVDSSAPNN